MSESHASTEPAGQEKHKAGLFDIRMIIGALIGIYGVILTLMGLLGGHTDKTKAAGININLWAGLIMLVFAAAFIAWARLRPIVVPDHVEEDDRPPGH